MSDQGGGDRPRWEGFPGGAGADPYATGPIDQPVAPPQFPVQPPVDETAPIPTVQEPPADPDGAGLGPRRSRSHAAPRRDSSRYVAYACAAAVVLVGAGFGFVACSNNGGGVSSSGSAPIVPLTTPSPTMSVNSTTPLPTASATPTATTSATASASASATATATASATATSSATSSPSPSATATVVAVKQPVVVLNSTAITGLAKRVAANIEAGGWTVTKTTNWKGAQPSVSTIYYLPGAKNKASAKLFAKKFDVARAVKPALPGMTSNLTLVLTRDAS